MIYLVWKDLLLQKRMLYIMFLYIILFSFSFQSLSEGQFHAVFVAISYMFVMTGCAWEDKNNSDVLWNSLPIAQWKIVGAKFLSIVAYALVVIPAYWLVKVAYTILKVPISMAAITGGDIATGIMAVFLVSSLYLPVFFALGYTKSRYWNILLFIGAIFLASIVPQLFRELPIWLQELNSTPMGIILASGGLTVLVVAVSFFVSLLLYRRREF